jgi:hypothetical protein
MKILAGFYTNNKIRPELLKKSIECFQKACSYNKNIIPIISSWEHINCNCKNVVSKYKNNGYLNILLQQYSIVLSCDDDWDYFAFCEHDCLYPENYFEKIFEVK